MNSLQRTNGTFAAIFNDDECTHKHGSAKAAESCYNWEAGYQSRHGTSAWAAEAERKSAPTTPPPSITVVSDDATAATSGHEYIPAKDLVALWSAMTAGAAIRPAGNMLFVGPSGSGKTDGARYLAALAGLEFTKIDAASMTDPESWFGNRDLTVNDDGVQVTTVTDSAFVTALQRPGFILIDEITRVRDEHRNVILPLIDHTREVMNPLTGKVVKRHPKCFIAMAGNVGIAFTGTSAVDPAFWTRARTVEFTYLEAEDEQRVLQAASGCDKDTAYVLVRFADETRIKARTDDEFRPVSTREIIEAGRDVHDGLNRDLAVKFNIINSTSSEGGNASIRTELEAIWAGVRITKAEPTPKTRPAAYGDASQEQWMCATHNAGKTVPAGMSSRTGKPYAAFRACPVKGCQNASDRPIK